MKERSMRLFLKQVSKHKIIGGIAYVPLLDMVVATELEEGDIVSGFEIISMLPLEEQRNTAILNNFGYGASYALIGKQSIFLPI